MIILDTGPIVAAALTRDVYHRACVDLLNAAHRAGEHLLIPSPVVTEVCYLLAREAGPRGEAAFLASLADGHFTVVELEPADLVVRYADLPLGAVDAAVVAIAERLNVTRVATLDRRHFGVVRPGHVGALILLPH